ncbi:hypothetical protein [Paractinoplanes maris]|uniref:hypothetical protein n=1 Tax=Paractinoplanes maris TaxID=1734446 RepID=UPI00201FB85E|nr:hypothetical protein [Actinoplanes maris]
MMRGLAWAEARRLTYHPAVLAGFVAAAFLSLPRWFGGQSPPEQWLTQTYEQLTLFWAPLHLGAFVAGAMVALRGGGERIDEMFAARPVDAVQRTRALFLAGIVPMGYTAALVVVNVLLVVAAGGMPLGSPAVIVYPTVVDVIYAVSLTGAAYAGGIVVARTVPSPVFTFLSGLAATWIFFGLYWISGWFPAYFLTPYVSPLSGVVTDNPTGAPVVYFDVHLAEWLEVVRDTDVVFWRAVYLCGVTLLLTAYGLRQSGRPARTRGLWLIGAFLALGGFLLQIPAYSGTWSLLGSWWDF